MARLSKIALTEEEKQAFALSLSSVIGHFEVLSTFDTTDDLPLYSVLDNHTLALREDCFEPSLSKEAFLNNAPSCVGGLIRVPQVLK